MSALTVISLKVSFELLLMLEHRELLCSAVCWGLHSACAYPL